jgi:hypothetical protein
MYLKLSNTDKNKSSKRAYDPAQNSTDIIKDKFSKEFNS